MARDYVALYERLLEDGTAQAAHAFAVEPHKILGRGQHV
jgi:hypothetical protein